MNEQFAKEIEEERLKQSAVAVNTQPQEMSVGQAINNQVQTLFNQSISENKEGVKALTDKAVQTELEIKTEEVEGRKEVEKSKIRQNVTKAKTEEDEVKHKRAETILKSQGVVKPVPAIFRWVAIGIGFPFFIIYLLTFGWALQLLTYVIEGFITMVADCADRFAEVNKKFIENGNEKEFKLGRAMVGILKWALIIGAVLAVVILLVVK